jgi:hypothetical protein
MNLSASQHRQLCAVRGSLAGSGGVLLLGGALSAWFAVPTSVGYWLGWALMALGVMAGLFAAALYFVPHFLLPTHRRKATRGGRGRRAA